MVLIGCHSFTALGPLPAVENNLTSLRDALANPNVWGVPEDKIEVLAQPSNDYDILSTVQRAANSARDTLVVYYAGHGLTDPLTGELYLALTDSRKEDVLVQRALRFEYLRRLFLSSGANKKVLLVDCCYSGRALLGAMGGHDATDAIDNAIVEGTCVITATSETALARAVPGEKFTAFTGVLLDTLSKGLPGAGALLDMETLYGRIRSELKAQSLPLPEMRNRNMAGRICIARNRAPAPALPSSPLERLGRPEPRPPSVDGLRLETSQVRIYSAIRDAVIGSGFLVAADVVCTCAHVVAEALGVPETTETVTGAPLELDFPLLSGRPRVRASVVSWRRGGKDVALLRLDTAVVGSQPAPLVGGTDVWGNTVRVLGFPYHFEAAGGVWVSGALRARTAEDWLQVETSSQAPIIGAGFSGSPAWDEAQGGVVGMIVAAHRHERTVYLVPAADLVDERTLPRWRCPFPGLAAFTEDEAEFFYSREADTDRVHTAVRRQPVTLVVGPSGCGKSSLVRAGVLPRLRADAMSVSELRPKPGVRATDVLARWLIGLLEPELDEIERLAKAEQLARQIETGGQAAAELRGVALALPEGSRQVLFIDQFEEYVDAAPDASRDLFKLLADLSDQDGAAVLRVVATARPDSLDLLVTPSTSHFVGNTVQFLGPLTDDDLKRAITAPVAAVPGLRFEPGLPERIAADAGDEPGRTPLVQFVLAGLWERRTPSMLTHAAYDSLDGVPGALVIHADDVLATLTRSDQECARRLFVQLTRPGDGDTFRPRSVRVSELVPEVMIMAKELSYARLVVLSRAQGGAGQEDVVELAHEALTRLWPRLTRWLVESRDFRLWQETLRADLNRWNAQHRDPDRLLRGADLAEASRRMALDPRDISADERGYILLSQHSRRRVRLKQAAIGALTVLTVLAAALGAVSWIS
ncbi:trypsin-like peptidase domain-containing protein [Streptomyces bobili]|uniref:caspase, EACC1-associated type n=1 Tax=Streptomyces bobili TaxID=67280 RepID=UPI0033E09CA7